MCVCVCTYLILLHVWIKNSSLYIYSVSNFQVKYFRWMLVLMLLLR